MAQSQRALRLVQRTTAKEQNRRLIAAELPASFIKKHGAVVVENHVNMVRPANDANRAHLALNPRPDHNGIYKRLTH